MNGFCAGGGAVTLIETYICEIVNFYLLELGFTSPLIFWFFFFGAVRNAPNLVPSSLPTKSVSTLK